MCCGFACLGWGKLTLTKKFLFGLKMAWDQELSSGLILLMSLTMHPFLFLSAVTEHSSLFTLSFSSGRRSSRLRISVVTRFDVPHVQHHLHLPVPLRDGPCQGTGGSFGFQEAATEAAAPINCRSTLSRYASFPISMRGTHPMVCDVRVLAASCPTIRKGAFENVSDRTCGSHGKGTDDVVSSTKRMLWT